MRIVPVNKEDWGQTCIFTFNSPSYFPLSRYTISDLEIQIYDSFGRAPMKFTHHVVCQLHFRKGKRNYKEEPGSKRLKLDESI